MTSTDHDREDLRHHLSMLQSVITRMADNSRACKTWAVTLVAAILVVAGRFGIVDDDSTFEADIALIAFVPTVLFWILDSYYLALERRFRASYDEFVAKTHSGGLEREQVFEIKPKGSEVEAFFLVQTSFSIWLFYLAMAGGVAIFWFALR